MTDPGAVPPDTKAPAIPPPPPPPPPPHGWARAATYTPAIVPARARDLGRIGQFVGGYFGLSFLFGLWGSVHPDIDVLGALVSAGFVALTLVAAERWRGTELDALSVLAAAGSTGFVLLTARDVGDGLALDDRALFWFVLLVCFPVALASLLRFPHPLLGINVAVASFSFVVGAPIGDGDRVAAGKAVLLALLLAGIAITVDLRTRSRAGSLLHYSSVLTFVVAKGLLLASLDPGIGTLVLAALGGLELSVALLMRRRLWAISGWTTLAVSVASFGGIDTLSAALGGIAAIVVALPIVWAAVTVQREGERVRDLLLAALPPELARAFPP